MIHGASAQFLWKEKYLSFWEEKNYDRFQSVLIIVGNWEIFLFSLFY